MTAGLNVSSQELNPPKLSVPALKNQIEPLKVSGLAPANAVRGAKITITGQGFQKRPELYVFFPGINQIPSQIAVITRQTDTELEVIVPPLAESGPLTVLSLGENDSEEVQTQSLSLLKPPAIKQLSRSIGAAGMRMFITGYNIGPDLKPIVKFAGDKTAELVNIGFYKDKGNRQIDEKGPLYSLEVKIPAGAVTGSVTISTINGATSTGWNFQIAAKSPPPKNGVFQVERIVPGQAERGARVTVHGKGFLKRPELYVRFSDSSGTPNQTGSIVSKTDTAAIVIVPPFAGSGKVQITSSSGIDPPDFEDAEIAGFTVAGPPSIGEFQPVFGRPGSRIIVKGWNIGSQEAPVVRFAGVKAGSILSSSYHGDFTEKGPLDVLEVLVPEGAQNGPLTILTPGGSFVTTRKFIVRSDSISVKEPPLIEGFSPEHGPAGSEIIIYGKFAPERLNNLVKFGEKAAGVNPSFCDGKVMKVIVPADGRTGPVTVKTPGGEVKSARSFYLPPQIIRLSAYQGPAGYIIKIYGRNFDLIDKEANLVRFNNANATVLNLTSGYDMDILEVEVPPEAVSGPVSVTTPGGAALSPGNFTIIQG